MRHSIPSLKMQREKKRGGGEEEKLREKSCGRGKELARPASVAKNRNETRPGGKKRLPESSLPSSSSMAGLLGCSSMIVLVPGALVVESSRFSNVATKTKQKSGRNKAESRMSWPGRLSLASLSLSISLPLRRINYALCIDGDVEWGKDGT